MIKKQKYQFLDTLKKGRPFCYVFDWEKENVRNKRESIRFCARNRKAGTKLKMRQGYDKQGEKCLIIIRIA